MNNLSVSVVCTVLLKIDDFLKTNGYENDLKKGINFLITCTHISREDGLLFGLECSAQAFIDFRNSLLISSLSIKEEEKIYKIYKSIL